jgi:hypothetical protein
MCAQRLIPTECGMLLPGNRTDDFEYDSNCCLLLTLNCLLHDKYDTLSRAMFIRFCKDNYHLLDHVSYHDKDVLKIAVEQALEESAILHQQIDSILIHIFAWYHNIRIVMRYGNRKSSDTDDDIIDSIKSFGPVDVADVFEIRRKNAHFVPYLTTSMIEERKDWIIANTRMQSSIQDMITSKDEVTVDRNEGFDLYYQINGEYHHADPRRNASSPIPEPSVDNDRDFALCLYQEMNGVVHHTQKLSIA